MRLGLACCDLYIIVSGMVQIKLEPLKISFSMHRKITSSE